MAPQVCGVVLVMVKCWLAQWLTGTEGLRLGVPVPSGPQ